MADLFGKIGDLLSGKVQEFQNSSTVAVEKYKLNKEATALKIQKSKQLQALGEAAYDMHKAGALNDDRLTELFKKIAQFDAEIENLNARIANLEKESADIHAPKEWKCKKCGCANKPGSKYCYRCGAPSIEPGSKKACSVCGYVNKPGAKFCGGCGKATSTMDEEVLEKHEFCICEVCETENDIDAETCYCCGEPLKK